MFSDAVGQHLFICDPFLVLSLKSLRGLPTTPQALRSAVLFTSVVSWLLVVLINRWHFWLQVLGFAFCCFTDEISKPWKPPMLHFFLWPPYHATGFVFAWITGNTYPPLRKYPKSMDVNKTKACRSQWWNPVCNLAASRLWSWLWESKVCSLSLRSRNAWLCKDRGARPQIVRKCL